MTHREFPARPRRNPWLVAVLGGLGLLASGVGAYVLLAPTSLAYVVEADALVVDAHLGALDQGERFPRDALRDARRVTLRDARRTAGTGLPGYCTGRWRFAEVGPAWTATSCGADAVVILGPDGPIVLTPADPDAFLATLTTPGATARFDPVSAPPRGAHVATVAVLLGLLALLPLALLAWILGRPMVYRVEDGTLVVPAHFRPVRVRLAGARVTRGPLGGALRLAGSALPGFYLGLFRASGRNLHVAATDLKEGVLVEGDRTVYVSPADLDAFCAAITP